jgi:hypothetical protein
VTSDLEPQTFKGKPVLTWGERDPVVNPDEIFRADPKKLYFVMVDRRYKEILKLRAVGEGVGTDMHEMVITKRNTALIIGYKLYKRDLAPVGRPGVSEVADGIVQEIDLTTGKLLLNWSAIQHIPLTESMFPVPRPDSTSAWDAYHPNSVTVTSDGNLLVSMRHTSTVYKIDRKTGKIIWKLGGKHSDFKIGPGADFLYQHDAQPLGGGRLVLFDNGATFTDPRKEFSTVKILQLDGAAKTASLVQDIVHEPAVRAVSQGNSRRLPNGNIFVGWGNREYFSEYTPEGQQLFDASVPSYAFQSYRAFKGVWSARPTSRPKVVADTKRGRTLVWVSWNGATDIASWRVRAGTSATTLKTLGTAKRIGFETRLDVAAVRPVLRVEALDRNGKVLGRSALVRPTE